MKKNILPLVLLVFWFWNCSNQIEPLAGGATDSPNELTGRIHDETNSPVMGAIVQLMPDAHTQPQELQNQIPGTINALDTSITDSNGAYSFQIKEPGEYAILAQTANKKKVLYIEGIRVDNKDIVQGSHRIKNASAIKGIADLPEGPNYTALIPGTPIQTLVKPNEPFVLEGLFGDSTELWIVISYTTTNTKNIATIDTVELFPGDTIFTDTLRISAVSPVGDSFMIENGDDLYIHRQLGGWWWTIKDSSQSLPINNSFRDSTGGVNGTGAIFLDYILKDTDTTGSVLGATLGAHPRPPGYPQGIKQIRDLSRATGLSMRVRGMGQRLKIMFHSGLIPDWNDLVFVTDALDTDWQVITIDFSRDLQHAHPTNNPRTWTDVGRGIDAIMFYPIHDQPGQSGTFWIDDLVLIY